MDEVDVTRESRSRPQLGLQYTCFVDVILSWKWFDVIDQLFYGEARVCLNANSVNCNLILFIWNKRPFLTQKIF
jgi:hypothetical protein